jgi:DNA mismatch repair protein MutS
MAAKIPSDQEITAMTPMLRQYFSLKKECEDCVLFFRMGDFYEIFGEDAKDAAKQLDIVLTSRERGDKNKIPFCGVPHQSADGYWSKLLKKNYKVAIADQIEDAKEAKGLVKRKIVKILTPGCIDEIDKLDANSPNYIMAVYESPSERNWAIALSDISTGEIRSACVQTFAEVIEYIQVFRPKEFLLRKFHYKLWQSSVTKLMYCEPLLGSLNEIILRDEQKAKDLFARTFAKGSGVRKKSITDTEKIVVAALLQHFLQLKISLNCFHSLKDLFDSDQMTLSENTVRSLELLETSLTRDSKSSLYHNINLTNTPMGARRLYQNLLQPYIKIAPIKKRHDLLTKILEHYDDLQRIREQLKQVKDLERFQTRLRAKKIRPQELAKIKHSLLKISQIVKLEIFFQNNFFSEVFKDLKSYQGLLACLLQAITDCPGVLGKDLDVFVADYDVTLQRYVDFAKHGERKILDYQESLRKETKITNLKIKNHKTYGLLIEVSNSHTAKVPESFIRRQTMVNCERFVTEELKEIDENISSARDSAIRQEEILYCNFLGKLEEFADDLIVISENVAELDVVCSLAQLAFSKNFTRPHINNNEKIELIASKHPVIADIVQDHNFVANDITLDVNSKHIVITGPNMAGKSTLMRQTALCGILSQIGSFVPAKKAVLPLFDQFYTRIGACDNISQGLSTFMVEMQETSQILQHATANSLVILDEIGRGTSSEDGLALACAILEYISENSKCWTLFSTHYHELIPIAQNFSGVSTYQVEVVEENSQIIFTHRFLKGVCSSSFGIEVAKKAGIPAEVLDRANSYLLNQEENCVVNKENPADNFLVPDEIIQRLQNICIQDLTPVQALNVLDELVKCSFKKSFKPTFKDRQSFL